MGVTMNERRVHARHEIALATEIKTERQTFTAMTRDLSAGGCCIAAAYPMDEGSLVGVSLFVVVDGIEQEGMAPLKADATVQWTAEADEGSTSERHLAGLKFVDITAEQSAWIEAMLARAG